MKENYFHAMYLHARKDRQDLEAQLKKAQAQELQWAEKLKESVTCSDYVLVSQ